jgi:hypothetical protein
MGTASIMNGKKYGARRTRQFPKIIQRIPVTFVSSNLCPLLSMLELAVSNYPGRASVDRKARLKYVSESAGTASRGVLEFELISFDDNQSLLDGDISYDTLG